MKKISVVLLALMSISAANLAQGYPCDDHGCDNAPELLVLLISSYGLSTTTLGNADDRAVYIQNVQDDAAAYLAGGDESALLQEAIHNLRDTGKVSGSDQQVATALVSAKN